MKNIINFVMEWMPATLDSIEVLTDELYCQIML